MSPHVLYEFCVQRPQVLVPWLESLHGRGPKVLHEDFCGTAAISRVWASRHPDRVAVGLDLDPITLDYARGEISRPAPGAQDRVRLCCGNALDAAHLLSAEPRADVIFVGNFSIGELPTREALLRYLRGARARLNPSGIFVCDTYGGAPAWRTGHVTRTLVADDGAVVRYTWEQRTADPVTSRVENALHFSVERAGEIVHQYPDAFVYRWRLWSFAELADALRECAYSDIEVDGAIDSQPTPPDEGLRIACILARR